jgi:hypothetical protein
MLVDSAQLNELNEKLRLQGASYRYRALEICPCSSARCLKLMVAIGCALHDEARLRACMTDSGMELHCSQCRKAIAFVPSGAVYSVSTNA